VNVEMQACEAPQGYVENSEDCDDSHLLYIPVRLSFVIGWTTTVMAWKMRML